MESNVLEKIILQQGQNMIHNALPRTLEPGYFFGPHCHENVELCLMLEGECDIIVNGQAVTVHAGEVMVIFSHIIHAFHMASDRPSHFLQMHFCPRSFLSMKPAVRDSLRLVQYMTDEHSAYLIRPYSPQLAYCLERICDEWAGEEVHHTALADTYVSEFILLLSREIEQSYRDIFVIHNPLAIKAIQYINGHLNRKISLADVAKSCNVTPRYLSEVFKAHVNITVNSYINIAKIDRATNYIGTDHLSVTETASRLGFTSTQYFAKVFKRYTGVSPSEFNWAQSPSV